MCKCEFDVFLTAVLLLVLSVLLITDVEPAPSAVFVVIVRGGGMSLVGDLGRV